MEPCERESVVRRPAVRGRILLLLLLLLLLPKIGFSYALAFFEFSEGRDPAGLKEHQILGRVCEIPTPGKFFIRKLRIFLDFLVL